MSYLSCEHKTKTIPEMMGMPRIGIIGLVECDDCKMVIGNCRWVEVAPLEYELVFDPPEIGGEK